MTRDLRGWNILSRSILMTFDPCRAPITGTGFAMFAALPSVQHKILHFVSLSDIKKEFHLT